MPDRLKDKVAIITGAGSSGPGWGNGKATAILFAREGAKILAVDLNLEAAQETERLIHEEGGECTALHAPPSTSTYQVLTPPWMGMSRTTRSAVLVVTPPSACSSRSVGRAVCHCSAMAACALSTL